MKGRRMLLLCHHCSHASWMDELSVLCTERWWRKMATTGGTMGGEQVNYNRDLLKGNHSGEGHVPLVPPGSATYAEIVS